MSLVRVLGQFFEDHNASPRRAPREVEEDRIMLPLLTGILVACLVATTPLLAAANEVVGWNETTVKAIEANGQSSSTEDLAASLLGWTPVFTDIEETITHAWNWMCNGARRDRENGSHLQTASTGT